MKGYKLTDEAGCTYGGMQWGEHVTHKVAASGRMKSCTGTCIHFYVDPLLAAFIYPAHVGFKRPRLWEGEAQGKILHQPDKSLCRIFTTEREIPLPEITIAQRVRAAITMALDVYHSPHYKAWAQLWTAEVTARVSWAAARAAARAAAEAAAGLSWKEAGAAWAAARASWAAAEAAEAAAEATAEAAGAAGAAWAAVAAEDVAEAAAEAARAAGRAGLSLTDILAYIRTAIEAEPAEKER